MLKLQQQRELSELDKSKVAVATQSDRLVAKYRETSDRQKQIISRCSPACCNIVHRVSKKVAHYI